ncbi:MAG: hypothetical protein IJL89_02285 [Firmicutes bacterium]|nr:hypothetical protein [Bacillota bacterium]
MEEIFNRVTAILLLGGVLILPPLLTVLNVLDLRRERHTKAHLLVTVVWGTCCWILLYIVVSIMDAYQPYNKAIPVFGMHEPFSTYYLPSLYYFAAVGFAGLLFIGLFQKLRAPLLKTFCIGAVYILNGLSALICIQLFPMLFHHPIALGMFYLYHFNILVVSVVNIKTALRGQDGKKIKTLILACVFAVLTALFMECSLSFTSQGFRGLPRVFTQTSDWTFSRQTSPEPYNVTREQWDD